jgi:uncharacterized membrane protein HdeD (DUF308 family)
VASPINLSEHRSLIITEGVLFTIFGFLAVILPEISTLTVELFLGWLMLFGGSVQLYRTLKDKTSDSFYGLLFTSILYIVFGLLLVIYPISGIISLTILLIFFFLLEGIAKIYLGFKITPTNQRIWFILNGVIALAMAGIIWAGWPGTAFWVLGLLVGINMIFFGLALIFFGSSLPKETT